MKQFTNGIQKMHILQLESGEDLLDSICNAIRAKGIRDAVVVAGLGTLSSCVMHIVASLGFPAQDKVVRWENVSIGVSAMNGTIINGEPHIHMVMSNYSDGNKTYTGHLEAGSRVMCRMEVMLCELEGPSLKRVSDENGIETIVIA